MALHLQSYFSLLKMKLCIHLEIITPHRCCPPAMSATIPLSTCRQWIHQICLSFHPPLWARPSPCCWEYSLWTKICLQNSAFKSFCRYAQKRTSLVIRFLIFFVPLGIECRALYMLMKHYTAISWACSFYFETGSC
jgi:hypothetical protein